MSAKFSSLLWLLAAAAAPAAGLRVATFNIGAHFTTASDGESYPDYSLGAPGTPDHETVRQILGRIGADVVALQEIDSADVSGNPDDLDALASSLGYPYLYTPPVAGAFDTGLRVVILSRHPFLTTGVVTSPAGARELTRLHPYVKVDVPGTANDPVLFSVHLKSGTTQADRFRRAVEAKRLVAQLGALGLSNGSNYLIVGDFNPSSTHTTFNSLPSGLPQTYALGADLSFPIAYSTNPATYFTTPAVSRLDPRQLDGSDSTFGTTTANGPTLDLFLVSPAIAARPVATEVYNSTLDTSNSTGLAKAGAPLAAITSATASDHFAVFADLQLDDNRPDLQLSLAPASIPEGSPDGTAKLTVTLPAAAATAVTVNLAADPAAAATPINTSAVIPAGSRSVQVPVRSVRDFLTAGSRSVSFTASSAAYDPASVLLQLTEGDAPYVFTAVGQSLLETFDGFAGGYAPSPWVTAGGGWQGSDTGASTATGFRAYGSAGEMAAGFLPQGAAATMSASYRNASGRPLTALDLAYDAEQWRAALHGTGDRIEAELVTPTGAVPLPALGFSTSTALPTGPVAGGAPVAKATTLSGLNIPSGQSFELRFRFMSGAGGGALPANVFLNEFHYDNDGVDSGEFVEVVVSPGYTGALSDIVLSLYNGSNGAVYGTHVLSTFTAGATTASGYRFFSKAIADLQNGAPDGFALSVGGQVVQFLSYEGAMTATAGPANGMTSTDIGVSQNGTEAAGQSSLGLSGSGSLPGDFSWTKFTSALPTPGQPNGGQSLLAPAAPSQGLAIDRVAVTFLPDNDLDGIPDRDDPDDDNDLLSDADEAVFGSDPNNPASRFRLALDAAGKLSFPTATGRSYRIEQSIDLSGWTLLETRSGTGAPMGVEVPVTGAPRRFFRVVASMN